MADLEEEHPIDKALHCLQKSRKELSFLIDKVQVEPTHITILVPDLASQDISAIRERLLHITQLTDDQLDVIDARLGRVVSTCAKIPTECSLIQYQLPVMETGRSEKFQIRKLVHGKAGDLCRTCTVMLVGETGTGKSTMIDAMVNYIYGIQSHDLFRLRIVNTINDETPFYQQSVESQTKWVTCYTIHPNPHTVLPYTLNIIDTPGFGDTGGLERDEFIVQQMQELFRSSEAYGLDTISSICLVLKSDLSRLQASTRSVISKTLQLFGKDTESVFTIIGTHFVDSKNVLNVLKKAQMYCVNQMFVNNAWLVNTCKSNSTAKYFFDNFQSMFNEFCQNLPNVAPCSVKMTAEVAKERILLEESVCSLTELIKVHVEQFSMIKKQEMLEKDQLEYVDIPLTIRSQKPSFTRNMCCADCKIVCRSNVGRFQSILNLFERAPCNVCECKIDHHIVSDIEYISTTEMKRFTYKELFGDSDLEQKSRTLTKFKQEKTRHESKMIATVSRLKGCIVRLNEIALYPVLISSDAYIDQIINAQKLGMWKGMVYQSKFDLEKSSIDTTDTEMMNLNQKLKAVNFEPDSMERRLSGAWKIAVH